MAGDRDRRWLRAQREFDAPAPARVSEPVAEVTCPGCFRPTDRVHMFEVPVFLFALWILVRSCETVAGCPRCVRRRLWWRLLVSLPMSNFVFPVVAPIILWDLARTYWDEDPSIPPEYHEWANSLPPPPQPVEPPGNRGRRVLLALAAVLVAAVVLFFVLPRVLR
jgi:hypothetical protein